jgi:hypothetical protein
MAYIVFSIVMIVTVVAHLAFFTRLKLEIIRNKQKAPEYEAKDFYIIWKLLRLHKSIFPISRTRRFYFVSIGFWLLLVLTFIAVLVADRFLHTNLLHQIFAGR